MNIAIIGPSGAGKGTHAASLCTRFRLQQVSTGDLLRENLRNHTALGILTRKYLEHAELVPDEVVDAMIEEWCNRLQPERGALFDGFPRTAYQARFLDELLLRYDRPLDAVIYLTVDDDEIVRRLAGRFICRSCQRPYHQQLNPSKVYGVCDDCGGELYHRPDDSTELVRARLRAFHRTTLPMLDHYATLNQLFVVSGEGTIAEVDERLVRALEAIKNRSFGFAARDSAALLPKRIEGPRAAPHPRPTLDILLIGGPGSGKGTQATLLSEEFSLPHIATGDLFRENLRARSELGIWAKTYMDRGELVPDDVTEAMLEERLVRPDVGEGFILDGFPRNLTQAHALADMLARGHRQLAGVLYLHATDETILERLSGRMTCRNCQASYHRKFKAPKVAGVCDVCGRELYQRADDNPLTVTARLATFHGQTEPLIAYYRQAGLLEEVSADEDVELVNELCREAIRRFKPSLVAPSVAHRVSPG
jgi:adenylate kinase